MLRHRDQKQVLLGSTMDASKRRRKCKQSLENIADEFVEASVPLLAAEEALDNGQPPKGNDRGHAEDYHGELLFDLPNPSDVVEQSDELDSIGSEFIEASLSSVTNNRTESETRLLDEWLKNDNRNRNLPLDSRDPDFDELLSYVRDDLLNRREDIIEDGLNSKMNANEDKDEDVWFDVEEHLSCQTMLASFLVYLMSRSVVVYNNQKKTPSVQKRKLT